LQRQREGAFASTWKARFPNDVNTLVKQRGKGKWNVTLDSFWGFYLWLLRARAQRTFPQPWKRFLHSFFV
jgi:hypothetical protein